MTGVMSARPRPPQPRQAADSATCRREHVRLSFLGYFFLAHIRGRVGDSCCPYWHCTALHCVSSKFCGVWERSSIRLTHRYRRWVPWSATGVIMGCKTACSDLRTVGRLK
ncbi:hypothetical protein LX32DRAFT_190245 [Colletotrichum zoysiae]|uniref:Uncharacterized protein n=1 Tax=Colletotrichum zoysiae TaxID=1216348 RepID=A0AAD9H682_9PEZI|nr:hypothetical protein LX32DRAFT_190245 [Colletotrichum zoysiae]